MSKLESKSVLYQLIYLFNVFKLTNKTICYIKEKGLVCCHVWFFMSL